MRFFQEVYVAHICYLDEVADWMVRASAPQAFYADDGREIRGNLDALRRGFCVASDPLSHEELEHFGSELFLSEYFDALYGPQLDHQAWTSAEVDKEAYFSRPENVATFIKSQREKAASLDEDRRAILEKELAQYFEEMDRARAEIMAATVSGKLKLFGFWAPDKTVLFDDPNNPMHIVPQMIPLSEISPTRFNWHNNTLRTRRPGAYFEVNVRTSDIFELFPARQGESVSMSVFNGHALHHGDDAGRVSPHMNFKSRGRPRKADWLEDAIRAWYQRQRELGNLGEKQESDLAAAQEFALSLGQPLGRTTFQNYLKGLLGPAESQ